MKISEITPMAVAKYLRLESGDYDGSELQAIMESAKRYIVSYTGIPAEGTGETLDDHEDFYIAFMVLCQDMYDNRSYAMESSSANRVVDSILGMHVRNLL